MSNLESLRKEAKRWLKALRANDRQALDRLVRFRPGYKTLTLRVVQHALALENGFPNWAALKQEFEERAFASRSHAERVTVFLEKSANRYGVAPGSAKWNTYGPDTPANGQLAARLLSRHPEIARDSIHTAVAAHDIERGADVDAVERQYNSTPLGHANYQGRKEMVAVLVPHSRDIRGLCFAGALDRLAELLSTDSSLANALSRGEAPLFALPDDDELAVEVVELLLAHQANPEVKNSAGFTPCGSCKEAWAGRSCIGLASLTLNCGCPPSNVERAGTAPPGMRMEPATVPVGASCADAQTRIAVHVFNAITAVCLWLSPS